MRLCALQIWKETFHSKIFNFRQAGRSELRGMQHEPAYVNEIDQIIE